MRLYGTTPKLPQEKRQKERRTIEAHRIGAQWVIALLNDCRLASCVFALFLPRISPKTQATLNASLQRVLCKYPAKRQALC